MKETNLQTLKKRRVFIPLRTKFLNLLENKKQLLLRLPHRIIKKQIGSGD